MMVSKAQKTDLLAREQHNAPEDWHKAISKFGIICIFLKGKWLHYFSSAQPWHS